MLQWSWLVQSLPKVWKKSNIKIMSKFSYIIIKASFNVFLNKKNIKINKSLQLWDTLQRVTQHRINYSLIIYLLYFPFTSPIHQNIKQCISLCIPELMCLIFFCISYFGKVLLCKIKVHVSQLLRNVTFPEVYTS